MPRREDPRGSLTTDRVIRWSNLGAQHHMIQSTPILIGVGFDTARYGHHVAFLRPDLQPAAPAFTFPESAAGYAQLRQALEQLQKKHGSVHFHMRIDTAGQYAINLERFLRAWPGEKTLSVGQPKQNRDSCKVHFPKRKADPVEALACARFALVEHPAPTPETPPAFAHLREIAGALESQAQLTTALVNQLHNRLARVFPELALNASSLRAAWVLRLLAQYPTPARIAAAHRVPPFHSSLYALVGVVSELGHVRSRTPECECVR